MASPFAHLHVHSHYSLMRGVDTLEALAQAARERGMDRFALTDTNALYGFVFADLTALRFRVYRGGMRFFPVAQNSTDPSTGPGDLFTNP